MQFHLNGYRPGDPAIAEPLGEPDAARPDDGLPAEVDVLIVGSGPTGLTLAAQLAAFPDITTRIVDQRPGRLLVGQADGIACRTMEMFQAFGFCERVLKEAYWVNETAFWKPRDGRPDEIARSGRIQDTEDGLSEFPHVILNQARVHDFYLDAMRNAPARLEPSYGRRFLDLDLAAAEPPDGHPVTVRLERVDDAHQGEVETVRARYVVGCDGARSGVRRALGRALHGDSANQAWGVMDVLAVTDFPDIRLKAAIHSAHEGSLLVIPREGGYLVRLYIELDKLRPDERVADRAITVDRLVAAAQRILHPYTLEVKEVAWWSVYEIGQRLCDRFDDVPAEEAGRRTPRVFIAGDACHTHSPKAGQGMNVSMQDGFNLGWKLASVIRGRSTAAILHTYSSERQGVARELIDFDRAFAKMFSAAPKQPGAEGEGIDPEEFQRYFVKQGRFTAGTETCYAPSLISAEPRHQHLAAGLTIGKRFHSAPVIRLADAKPVQLGHAVTADGRWRLFVFADDQDPTVPSSRLHVLCGFLAASPDSPIRRATPDGADPDAIIDVRAILQQGHRAVAIGALPPLLRPRKGRYGLVDYEKVFCPDLKAGDVFDLRGIARQEGCVVVVRPDQYVAHVLPLDATSDLAAFFDAFMI
ncbi:FAD-binding monooxygenase [Methylobacterium oryzisoli]|uniref:FAD-binding monooxygenase n=1 Tax=Methylobacterium oryzisoli TaxID=3385502 RepID=UPI003891CD81